jgi:hypothetical protein
MNKSDIYWTALSVAAIVLMIVSDEFGVFKLSIIGG